MKANPMGHNSCYVTGVTKFSLYYMLTYIARLVDASSSLDPRSSVPGKIMIARIKVMHTKSNAY